MSRDHTLRTPPSLSRLSLQRVGELTHAGGGSGLDVVPFADDDDPVVGDCEALTVAFEIDADLRTFPDDDVLVEYRAADDRVLTDVHPLHEDAPIDVSP